MDKQTFSGKSLDEALELAAKSFQTDRSFLSYNIIPAGKEGGLLSRLFQRTVKVEAWVEHQPEDLQEAARAAVRQAIQGNGQAPRHKQNHQQELRHQDPRKEDPRRQQEQRAKSSVGGAAPQGRSDAQRPPQHPKADAKDMRANAFQRDARQNSANRDAQGNKGPRNPQNPPREPHENRDDRQPRPQREAREPRPPRPAGEAREPRPPRPAGEAREPRPPRPAGEAREPRPPRPAGEAREPRPPRPAVEAREPREPGLDFSAPGALESLQSFGKIFCDAFDIDPQRMTISCTDKNDALISVEDPFLETLLQKTDRLSLAFEHIFKRMAQKSLGDISSRVTLDALEAAKKREEALAEMALSMAEKVRQSGKSITLNSRSPLERRAIHLALDGAEGVATRSVGTGDHRKLVIYSTLKRESPRGDAQRQKQSQHQGAGARPGAEGQTAPDSNRGGGRRRKRKPKGKREAAAAGPSLEGQPSSHQDNRAQDASDEE